MNKKYTLLDANHIQTLKQLNITRNIKNVYDLECLLPVYIKQNNTTYYLKIKTIKVPSSRKTLTEQQIEAVNTIAIPERIYYRYYYVTENNNVPDIEFETWYRSKIDAIIVCLKLYLTFNTDLSSRFTIINQCEFGEYYNGNKKYKELETLRKDTKLDRQFMYQYQYKLDFVQYKQVFITKTYTFTSNKNQVFDELFKRFDYKRFNLYEFTDNYLTLHGGTLNCIIKRNNIKFTCLGHEFPNIYFCVSGMNIYYGDSTNYLNFKLNT